MVARAYHCYDDLRRAAWRHLPRVVFDYIDGSAGREYGARANRQALDDHHLMPRVLRDMRDIDISVEVLGQHGALPFGICPMGMCNLAHPLSDLAMADFAAHHSIPFGISTMSSTPMEVLAQRAKGHAWFQLYYSGDGAGALKLVERAKEAGFETLILTVDVAQVGIRLRERRHNLNIPFQMSARHFIDFASHPRWSLRQLFAGAPGTANFDGVDYVFERNESRAGANLDFLVKLRALWSGKLVVKGVLDIQDAQDIVSAGADAIIVSSHGCRQLDSAPAAFAQLAQIRAALGPDQAIFYDSSIQSGEDVIKAYANGADFVFVGRAWLYACALYGLSGPQVLGQIFTNEVRTTMALIGQKKIPKGQMPAIGDPK